MTNLLLLVLALQDEKPLPKIAEISTMTGSVEIVSSKGTVRKPMRFGTRLKNAEVRDEDKVKTGAGGQAVILFPDASKFTVKEKSEVQILQKELPKATSEGNTVGRRIKVLFGELVSDVIPNKEIRTDFEMPAGSAAVRGTRLRITTGGASSVVAVTDGLVRFVNAKYQTALNIRQDQRVRFTEGSLIIDVEADGGMPLTGQVGPRIIGMDGNDRLVINDLGPNLRGTIEQGTITLDGAPQTNPFETVRINGMEGDDTLLIDPSMPTGAPITDDASGGTGVDGEFPSATGEPNATEMLGTSFEQTNAAGGAAGSGFPQVIDDFNRPDSATIGNGWTEVQGTWDISGSRVLASTAAFNLQMDKDIGFQPTFDIQATFHYNAAADISFLELAVNAASPGCFVQYDPGAALLTVGDTIGSNSIGGVGTAAPFTDFTLSIVNNGADLCGSLSGGGITGGTVCLGTSAT